MSTFHDDMDGDSRLDWDDDMTDSIESSTHPADFVDGTEEQDEHPEFFETWDDDAADFVDDPESRHFDGEGE